MAIRLLVLVMGLLSIIRITFAQQPQDILQRFSAAYNRLDTKAMLELVGQDLAPSVSAALDRYRKEGVAPGVRIVPIAIDENGEETVITADLTQVWIGETEVGTNRVRFHCALTPQGWQILAVDEARIPSSDEVANLLQRFCAAADRQEWPDIVEMLGLRNARDVKLLSAGEEEAYRARGLDWLHGAIVRPGVGMIAVEQVFEAHRPVIRLAVKGNDGAVLEFHRMLVVSEEFAQNGAAPIRCSLQPADDVVPALRQRSRVRIQKETLDFWAASSCATHLSIASFENDRAGVTVTLLSLMPNEVIPEGTYVRRPAAGLQLRGSYFVPLWHHAPDQYEIVPGRYRYPVIPPESHDAFLALARAWTTSPDDSGRVAVLRGLLRNPLLASLRADTVLALMRLGDFDRKLTPEELAWWQALTVESLHEGAPALALAVLQALGRANYVPDRDLYEGVMLAHFRTDQLDSYGRSIYRDIDRDIVTLLRERDPSLLRAILIDWLKNPDRAPRAAFLGPFLAVDSEVSRLATEFYSRNLGKIDDFLPYLLAKNNPKGIQTLTNLLVGDEHLQRPLLVALLTRDDRRFGDLVARRSEAQLLAPENGSPQELVWCIAYLCGTEHEACFRLAELLLPQLDKDVNLQRQFVEVLSFGKKHPPIPEVGDAWPAVRAWLVHGRSSRGALNK